MDRATLEKKTLAWIGQALAVAGFAASVFVMGRAYVRGEGLHVPALLGVVLAMAVFLTARRVGRS
ncbi:hypothetical protein [Rhodocaloribacter sp.]